MVESLLTLLQWSANHSKRSLQTNKVVSSALTPTQQRFCCSALCFFLLSTFFVDCVPFDFDCGASHAPAAPLPAALSPSSILSKNVRQPSTQSTQPQPSRHQLCSKCWWRVACGHLGVACGSADRLPKKHGHSAGGCCGERDDKRQMSKNDHSAARRLSSGARKWCVKREVWVRKQRAQSVACRTRTQKLQQLLPRPAPSTT